MRVIHRISEMRNVRSKLTGSVSLVPTMGNLHDGHLQLVDEAKFKSDTVITSITYKI